MSLAQRVTSIESYGEREPGEAALGRSRGRRLSFSPIGDQWDTSGNRAPQSIAAHEVSVTRRLFQVLVAVVYCLLSAGIIFGYAALKPVLISEGVYRELCSGDEVAKGVKICYRQELRYPLLVRKRSGSC